MVRDGVLDDTQQLLLRVCGSNRQAVEELDHETSKPLEGSGDSYGRGHLDQNAFGGMDVNLQLASLVDGGVEQREKALC